MRDRELTERPGKGWTRWAEGAGEHDIERTWWQAKALHFPKLNVSVWFDGSEMVELEHWGFREPKWCMRLPPADWQPMPQGYRAAAEAVWQAWQAREGLTGQSVPDGNAKADSEATSKLVGQV
ncbi:hypothetical protein [Mesorhizobium sophorae]|uniref:hypothetical protein n=1 Tax=Mesorhizobium sophorae TaxID=1300294 RepID=UPI000BA37CD4|nr:hypothetical protein [Mesorhizobium sophorae]